MDEGEGTGAGWRADPWRTYEQRYFDGVKFTAQVSSGGKVATDPFFDLDAPLPSAEPAAAVVAPVEQPAPSAPPRRSPLPWVVLALVVLAIVAIVAVTAGGDDGSDDAPEDTTTIEEDTDTTAEPATTEAEPTTTEAPTTTEEPAEEPTTTAESIP